MQKYLELLETLAPSEKLLRSHKYVFDVILCFP